MKFRFEVLDPDEVRLAREIIKERISFNVQLCQQIKAQKAKQAGVEVPSEQTVKRQEQYENAYKEATRYQEMLNDFDRDYLDYLTSELKELPTAEIEVIDERDDEEEVPAWKA
jgi:hypothetical protein